MKKFTMLFLLMSAVSALTTGAYAYDLREGLHIHTIAANSQGDVFVGSEFGGIFRIENQGSHYVKLGFEDSDVEVVAVNSADIVFAGTSSKGVFRSADNGDTWTQVNSGLGEEPWVWGFLFLDNGDMLTGITGGVYRSDDDGDSWTPSGLTGYTVRWFTQAANGEILAGTVQHGIFRSADNGLSWSLTNESTVPFLTVRLVTAPDGIIYASTWGQGIYRSDDNGENWEQVNLETSDPRINFVVFDTNGTLYTSAENDGMYASGDNGETWDEAFGLLYRVKAINFSPDGKVYAGCWGSGIFHSETYGDDWFKPTGVETSTPLETKLQAYPNPFNPSTTITYHLAESGNATLSIYTISGQKVADLLTGYSDAGSYSVTWDASEYAAGVYFTVLKARNTFLTGKILLVK